MARWFSFRFIRTPSCRPLCRKRYITLAILVMVAFCIYPPKTWFIHKMGKSFETESTLLHSLRNVTFRFPSHDSGSSIPTTPDPRHDTSVTYRTKAKTRGYLMQGAAENIMRLGNQMFMYASLLGIADNAKMTPVYSKHFNLSKIFKISADSSSDVQQYFHIDEALSCTFDSRLFSLYSPHQNATITGFLQSWKYFNSIAERIKQEFTFKDELKAKADEFLASILANDSTPVELTDVLFIGVHIRRGDMSWPPNADFGYTVASTEYLAGAVNHYRTYFPASTLVFAVCTDDPDWSKQNFPMVDRNSFVAFSEGRTAAEDMAILASCNHTIITVGTYGWWSAYLAGGRTIYYKDFPVPGSSLMKLFNKEDYFPPHWLGL